MQNPEKRTPEFFKEMFSIKIHGPLDEASRFYDTGNLRLVVTTDWNVHLGSQWHIEMKAQYGINNVDVAVEGYVGRDEDNKHAEIRVVGADWHLDRLGVAGDEVAVIDALEAKIDEYLLAVLPPKK